ncbi:exopolysaccharide biosynthesis protein [Salinarimonas rosea]|uniref:exopolysaccharide biosynthesis protein n=1 Tax=Salinarimonas rosea TaxID=552063 RepID=UPI00146F942B|nr:exopolysaccharide biosynthesis protein [Salinarimonas rosea]
MTSTLDPALGVPHRGAGRLRRIRVGRGPVTTRVFDAARLLRGPHTTIGTLFDRLGEDGLGLALLLLTLATLIPVPGPFGMTFGCLIAFVALQIMVGARTLCVPSFLRRRGVPGRALRSVIGRTLPGLSRAELLLEEGRLAPLAGRRARVALAIPVLLLAVAIILPIPFGNIAPALALVALSLGIMARDGLMILAGLVVSLFALGWTGILVVAGAALIEGAVANFW